MSPATSPTVVGVTGSHGTSATARLLTTVLSSAAPTGRYLVLEVDACDIAEVTEVVAPDIALVLDVGPAHLGCFGSRRALASAQADLVRGLADGGTAVLNADDARVAGLRWFTDGPVLTFGRGERADVRVLDLTLDRRGRPSFTLRSADASAHVTLPRAGAHQARDAAAAAAAALAAGVPLDVAADALSAS